MRIVGRHYATAKPIELEIAGERIADVRPLAESSDITLPWIAPGFVDLQINGGGGQEFSAADLTPEKVAHLARSQARFGVTRFCPTVTTAARDVLEHSLRTIAAACDRWPDVARRIPGIHLEGPYISAEDGPRGAHPRQHCRPPDWDEFRHLQDAAGGRIRLVTLAAEYANAATFIARLVAAGVRAAIGHTAADSRQIRAAVDSGAVLSTHLGNGAHPVLPRHPNYIWDQLADDRLTASLIVDGHHLPPAVVKSFVRAKTPQRCILVSDLSGYAGLPPGCYSTALCDLEILASGRLVVAGQDQLLAAASAPIGVGVMNVIRFAGVDLPTAIHMASTQPANLIGAVAGSLEPGGVADLALFHLPPESADAGLVLASTLIGGELAYSA